MAQTHTADSRKPAFRWLGLKGRAEDESTHNVIINESRKRSFGVDVTNISYKRSKVDSPICGQIKHASLTHEIDGSVLEQDSKQRSRSYQYGPFAPVTIARVGQTPNSNLKRVHDWESLASTYRLQYQNQGMIFALLNIGCER